MPISEIKNPGLTKITEDNFTIEIHKRFYPCIYCYNEKVFTNRIWITHIPSILEKYKYIIGKDLYYTDYNDLIMKRGMIKSITLRQGRYGDLYLFIYNQYLHTKICINEKISDLYVNFDGILKPLSIIPQYIHLSLEEEYKLLAPDKFIPVEDIDKYNYKNRKYYGRGGITGPIGY